MAEKFFKIVGGQPVPVQSNEISGAMALEDVAKAMGWPRETLVSLYEMFFPERHYICALLYLNNKCSTRNGKNVDAISRAEHDEIYLAFDTENLTRDDVLYINRCGVRLGEYGLCMFV